MEEIFGLSFVSNAIPPLEVNVKGSGYNFVASVNDLSDMFLGATINGAAVSSNHNTTMTLSGSTGESYTVLANDNLANPLSQWTVVGGGRFSGNAEQFTDTDGPNHPNRFYTLRLR
jgi:hypothetical protein